MADMLHVDGLKELQAALKDLPDRIARNVLQDNPDDYQKFEHKTFI